MKIEGFIVSERGNYVGIKPEYSCLTRMISKEEYNDSLPKVNIEPGMCIKHKIKADKMGYINDWEWRRVDVYFSDNQVWLDFRFLHPTKWHKDLFKAFAKNNKDTHAEYWDVRCNDNTQRRTVYSFTTEEEARDAAKKIDRNIIPEVRYQKVINPKLVKSAVKLPFVPLFLDEYDIAKNWHDWLSNNNCPELSIDSLIKVIKLVRG